jgi:hypothetical protein
VRWRPIRTAPKDEIILLAEPPNPARDNWFVMTGRWITLPHTNELMKAMKEHKPITKIEPHWLACYPGIMVLGGAYNGKTHEGRDYIMHPTHWMPLPNPPRGKFRYHYG